MKYTSNAVIQKIYDVVSAKKDSLDIDGDVYKLKAPTNSKKVNIVVNALATDTETLQKSVININTYVPLVAVEIDDTVTAMPDFVKIEAIDNKLSTIFAEYYGDDFNAYFIDSKTFEIEGYSVVNLKIRVNLFNNN